VLQIQDSYFSLQEQQQLISSYEEILAATTRQVETTEAQFNSGVASIADVEQIRTQQYGTLTTLINAYQQLITSAAQVAKSMALPPGTLIQRGNPSKPSGIEQCKLECDGTDEQLLAFIQPWSLWLLLKPERNIGVPWEAIDHKQWNQSVEQFCRCRIYMADLRRGH
jgi:hypothetical protein